MACILLVSGLYPVGQWPVSCWSVACILLASGLYPVGQWPVSCWPVACILLASGLYPVGQWPVSCCSVLSHLDRCLSLEENVFSAFFLATRLLPTVTHRSTCWEASSCSAIFEACYLDLYQLLSSYTVGNIWMNVEHLWNNADRRKQKNLEKNLSRCCFAHCKLHMEWLGIEP